MPARRSYATKWVDNDSLLLVHNHRIVDSSSLQTMDVSRRSRSTPNTSTPVGDRGIVVISNSNASNTTTTAMKSSLVKSITVKEARDEECNYEAVPDTHVGGDDNKMERDDVVEASPVYWSVEYERQQNKNQSTPCIYKKDSAVDSGASSDLTKWMNSAKQSVSSNNSSSSKSSSSKKSKETSKAEVKTMMAAMSTPVEDELDLLVKRSGMTESGTFDETSIKCDSKSLPSIAEEKSTSNNSKEASKTSAASNTPSIEVVFVDTPSPMTVQATATKRHEEMNLDELVIPIVKSEESLVYKRSVEIEEASDVNISNMATKEDTTKELGEDITRSLDLHLLVSKLWTAETVDANLFDSQVAESTSQRKNIITTIGDNTKLSTILSLTKKIQLEEVKSTLVKSKTAIEAHTERLFGSMESIKTVRFAKLFQKTAKPGSEIESRVIQGNDSFESNRSTTSSWIASRRSALSEKSATSTIVSKKLEKIVKAENDSADEDKFSIQDDVSNGVVGVMTGACEMKQSTPTVDHADKIASFPFKRFHLNNMLATGSSKSKQITTVKKSILKKAHMVRKSKMNPGRVADRSIEINKEVSRGNQHIESNIECQGSVEGAMSIMSNKTDSSKKSTKSIAEIIYQEYRGVNESTPRAMNTCPHKTLWPITTDKETSKEETPTYSEIFDNSEIALERKMSTMSHSSWTNLETSQGQSQIAKSEIALEKVQLPATEDVASSTEGIASQQMAIDVQQQKTPGKCSMVINCGVFNCVAGFDL